MRIVRLKLGPRIEEEGKLDMSSRNEFGLTGETTSISDTCNITETSVEKKLSG